MRSSMSYPMAITRSKEQFRIDEHMAQSKAEHKTTLRCLTSLAQKMLDKRGSL
jgi:hypothetical protein